jgi:hypothetical protein
MGAKRSKYADCDFKGWATKFGILCADGRIIQHGAFDDIDGTKVPLVYNHDHGNINSVLGHAYMECRKDGVYAYGYFNGSDNGQIAKDAVQHGDMDSLSIWANHLQQRGPYVQHGEIKELSLVLAGANPGAYIEDVALAHGDTIDNDDYEAYIYSGEYLEIMHSDEKGEDEVANNSIQDVVDTMTPEQKDAFYMAVGSALAEDPNALEDEDEYEDEDEEDEEDDYDDDEDVEDPDKDDDDSEEYEEEDDDMGAIAHNLFEGNNTDNGDVLSHSEMQEIIEDSKRYGSMKESFLAHGITNIEYLFPDAKNLNTPPEFIARDQGWITEVMNGVHHTPFSRIKSTFADLREDEARARGYIKGKLKKEEVFSLLKRTTTPQTIYKKQKIDRDDVIDITDFDVIVWLKAEMRMMLNEEIARAVLVGDGRLTSSDDHIKEDNVRPIWKDADLYTIKYPIAITKETTAAEKATAFIEACVRARIDYKGSGNPKLFAPESIITECLLLKDKNGRIIYDNIDKLATACRVSKIVSVPVMEGLTRVDKTDTLALQGIIVNLQDYNIGADKGGAINMFDDFDIDYNAQKYLIETRISGALIKPLSAIAIETKIPTADLSKTVSGQSGN